MAIGKVHDPNKRAEFLQGVRDGMTIVGAAAPFGMLFGAIAIDAGMSPFEVMLASALMFAGASQFVMIEVYGLGVPAWSVILAVLAVNFRHLLYSASLGRKMTAFSPLQKGVAFIFLTDPQWGASEMRAERVGLRPSYYFGYASLLYTMWLVATAIGIAFGALIDDLGALGLDFLLPIYFMTLVMGFRSRANWLMVVLVSGTVSLGVYLTIGAPWHISVGGLAGIVAAAVFGAKPDETSLTRIGGGDE